MTLGSGSGPGTSAGLCAFDSQEMDKETFSCHDDKLKAAVQEKLYDLFCICTWPQSTKKSMMQNKAEFVCRFTSQLCASVKKHVYKVIVWIYLFTSNYSMCMDVNKVNSSLTVTLNSQIQSHIQVN